MLRRWHINGLDIYPFNHTNYQDALIRESGTGPLQTRMRVFARGKAGRGGGGGGGGVADSGSPGARGCWEALDLCLLGGLAGPLPVVPAVSGHGKTGCAWAAKFCSCCGQYVHPGILSGGSKP